MEGTCGHTPFSNAMSTFYSNNIFHIYVALSCGSGEDLHVLLHFTVENALNILFYVYATPIYFPIRAVSRSTAFG